jgi:hypothetical protein
MSVIAADFRLIAILVQNLLQFVDSLLYRERAIKLRSIADAGGNTGHQEG